jgi:hypothetical protein
MLTLVTVDKQRVVLRVQENKEDFDHVFMGNGHARILVRRKRNLVMLDPIFHHERDVLGRVLSADQSPAIH